MFGDYNDLDICGINRGGGFDDPSDETNYSFDEQSDASASISDDYIDTFDSENTSGQVPPQNGNYNQQAANVGQQAGQMGAYQANKSSASTYMLVLVLIAVVIGGLFYYKKTMAPSQMPTNSQEMGDYFYDKAVENNPETPAMQDQEQPQAVQTPAENVATVDVDLTQPQAQEQQPVVAQMPKPKAEEKAAKPEQKKALASVVIPVAAGGRVDPFYPYNESYKTQQVNLPKYDIVAPPLIIPDEDPMVDKLMEVKITGIMYDNVRPSALIIVDGTEQLAHKGDLISDYKILNITKDKVVIKYKTNIFEVSAGQTFTPDGVNINPIAPSSLSKQFGGAYAKQSKNVIQF